MSSAGIVALILLGLPLLLLILLYLSRRKRLKQVASLRQVAETEVNRLKAQIEELQPFRDKYAGIPDAETYCEDLKAKAREAVRLVVERSKKEAADLQLERSRQEQIWAERERVSNKQAQAIIDQAEAQAQEIAGSALEAKAKAGLYEAQIKAMRNQISGYGDEYLVANRTVLDDLAEEYSHKDAGEDLKKARNASRGMVKAGIAATCDYVEAHRRNTAISFVLDAFNGKVDVVLAKVKHNNYGKLKQEMIDAFSLVNANGEPFRKARILPDYLVARQEELKLAVQVHELRLEEREEQRKIKEAMREEERVRREMERAIKQAEKEEKMLQLAMKEAREALEGAALEQRSKFEAQLAELQEKLEEAERRGERALSMAQQTKRGHVYVISNVGSFGEYVYKIGLTRRLEPLDRVKELGDASVPFEFDVHAMIYSEDAPALESKLHQVFDDHRVNKINRRKEFFRIDLQSIRELVTEHMGMDAETHWTMLSEAREYRESLAIAKTIEGDLIVPMIDEVNPALLNGMSNSDSV